MPEIGPLSARAGRTARLGTGPDQGAPFSWRHVLDFVIGKAPAGAQEVAPQKPKSTLSNAQFHLTASQMARIVCAAGGERDAVLLQLLGETGLRRAEVCALKVEDVNLAERILVVTCGKGRKTRLVPLTDSLADKLGMLIGPRTTGPVFLSARGSHLSPRQVNRLVGQAGKRAKVSHPNPKYSQITPHLFRHSFARLWKARGGDIEALAAILGHASVKTTWDLYGKLGAKDIQREFQRVLAKANRRTSKD